MEIRLNTPLAELVLIDDSIRLNGRQPLSFDNREHALQFLDRFGSTADIMADLRRVAAHHSPSLVDKPTWDRDMLEVLAFCLMTGSLRVVHERKLGTRRGQDDSEPA